jgi:hypothetical protein
MRMKRSFRRAALAALFFLPGILAAEFIDSGIGFYLDLPEGYAADKTGDKGVFIYRGPEASITFQVYANEGSAYDSADSILQAAKKRLGAEAKEKKLRFQGRDARYAEMSFTLAGNPMRGYGFFVDGRPGERDYSILSVSGGKIFEGSKLILLSALDSFSIDIGALKMPGPVSWGERPLDGGKEIYSSFEYAGAAVRAPTKPDWASASKAVVEREHAVLAAYADSGEFWMGAWKRFYRMVFRDSYSRLDSLSFALGVRMEELWRKGALPGVGGRLLGQGGEKAGSVEGAMTDEDKAEAAMALVQGYTYVRDLKGVDFTAPLSALLGEEGDCDARAMLAAILLSHWNIEAGMMVSRVYSHSMGLAAIQGAQGRNAGIEMDGDRYLVMETTDSVLPGFIDKEQSVAENWIGIRFLF